MQKKLEIFFSFSGISISFGYVKLSLLSGEYLSTGVNVLTNILKVYHITKREFFQMQLPSQ